MLEAEPNSKNIQYTHGALPNSTAHTAQENTRQENSTQHHLFNTAAAGCVLLATSLS